MPWLPSNSRTRFGRSASRRLPAAGRASVRPAEQRERRPQEDEQIRLPAAMADVPEVELDPLGPREPGAAVDLGPARDARLHVEPVQLPLVVLLDLVAQRRTRADDRHVAADDVPELRQLVEAQPSEDTPALRDARVAAVDGEPGSLLLGADHHGAQLQELEVGAASADADLLVEDGPAVLELDRERA